MDEGTHCSQVHTFLSVGVSEYFFARSVWSEWYCPLVSAFNTVIEMFGMYLKVCWLHAQVGSTTHHES